MRPRLRRGQKLSKSEQMARVRSSDTSPETALRSALWAAGIRFRLRPPLPGTPDIAIKKAMIAVFVDGCFWHGCPKHYTAPVNNADFWAEKLHRNLSRDRRVDAELRQLGWTPIRVWEHDIVTRPSVVANRLSRAIARAEEKLMRLARRRQGGRR